MPRPPVLAGGSPTDRSSLGRHTFTQPVRGYRFSIDSVLLASFTSQAQGPVGDFCAGCGVISVLLHARGLSGPFLAVEIDDLLVRCCWENYAAAGVPGRVLRQDLAKETGAIKPNSLSLVVVNPPFTKAGHGRVPADPGRARARQGVFITPEVLWGRAYRFLKPLGRLAFCWSPRRLPELLAGLPRARLAPKRMRMCHGREGKNASLVLVEAVKDGGAQLTVEPPLLVHGPGQAYTAEVAAIYRDLFAMKVEPASGS